MENEFHSIRFVFSHDVGKIENKEDLIIQNSFTWRNWHRIEAEIQVVGHRVLLAVEHHLLLF